MTYQNTSRPFAADMSGPARKGAGLPMVIALRVLNLLRTIFGGIGNALINAAEASSRVHRVEALHAKTDVELAKMGLKRDDIVYYVFRDLYYT